MIDSDISHFSLSELSSSIASNIPTLIQRSAKKEQVGLSHTGSDLWESLISITTVTGTVLHTNNEIHSFCVFEISSANIFVVKQKEACREKR